MKFPAQQKVLLMMTLEEWPFRLLISIADSGEVTWPELSVVIGSDAGSKVSVTQTGMATLLATVALGVLKLNVAMTSACAMPALAIMAAAAMPARVAVDVFTVNTLKAIAETST